MDEAQRERAARFLDLHQGPGILLLCNAWDAASARVVEQTIANLIQAIDGPVNILAVPGTSPVAGLADLGVRRVSLGSGPMRATLGHVRRIARELLESGTCATMASDTISYAEANSLFTRETR